MFMAAFEYPRCIAMGALVDPMWKTTLVKTGSGKETANQDWANALNQYDAALPIKTLTEYRQARAHHIAMRGRFNTFPFHDPLDHDVSQAEGVLVLISGANYQMKKRYSSGDGEWQRPIYLPLVAKVFRTRSAVTTDITGSSTIGAATGIVAVTGHAGGDTYAWSGQFNVLCRYDADSFPHIARDRQPGTNGELLIEGSSIILNEVRGAP